MDGVDVESYRNLIPNNYHGHVSIWGTSENNSGSFDRMERGDVVLFYVGDRTYSHLAVVRGTERNEALDEALWTPYDNSLQQASESWPLIMYLENPTPMNISSVRLHDDLGRNDEFPLGFTRVATGLEPLVTEQGGLLEYLDSISTTATSPTDDGDVPDMYTGPRGSGSASEQVAEELSEEELYERAKEAGSDSPSTSERSVTQYSRSDVVREYALRQADGVCEGCGSPAPFETKQGKPYLEVHHLTKLNDDGPDHPDAVAALCPTCHKRIHHGEDGNEYNQTVADNVGYDLN